MNEVWTRLQGHVVNGVFPLGRCLGCSEHSGVFLTRSSRHPAEVAIKLVPANRSLAESLLPRWKRAGGLAHPHLLRLLEWGGCQLDGLPYLYTVMEYADQTLAQLLQHRALTDDEAHEMLLPILDVLAFLHGRDLLQGHLKPSNVLVLGDRLTLASDTIRRFNEGTLNAGAVSVYDPPEARHGGSSARGDIWALGVTLVEALTRRRPSVLGEPRGAVAVPVDFSPRFRDLVVRCLAFRPEDRLTVTELVAWDKTLNSAAASVAGIQPAAVPSQPGSSQPLLQSSTTQISPDAPRSAPVAAQAQKPRGLLTLILAAVAIIVLGWSAVHVLRTQRAPTPPPQQAPAESPPRISGPTSPAAPAAGDVRASPRSAVAAQPAALHEVIPDVPQSARRTIRGHIKVWVRVVVDKDGSVQAAVADRTGPSTYFQQLAVAAARKWTFPTVDPPARRTMQIRFDFSRDATTAHAVPLH